MPYTPLGMNPFVRSLPVTQRRGKKEVKSGAFPGDDLDRGERVVRAPFMGTGLERREEKLLAADKSIDWSPRDSALTRRH